jgi:hypothetical protein
MNQEDREMANAALALDEKINERVFEALNVNHFAFEDLVMNAILRRGQYDTTFQNVIAKIVKDRIKEF